MSETNNTTKTTDFSGTTTEAINAVTAKGPDDKPWTLEQHNDIVQRLLDYGCEYIKGRDEYTLLKEVINPDGLTEVLKFRQNENSSSAVNTGSEGSGVNSPYWDAIDENDTSIVEVINSAGNKPFLTPLDIQKASSIADKIPSFQVIQSGHTRLNIGIDTEFQRLTDSGTDKKRLLLSIQMTVALGDSLIRYFFLIDPRYQVVTREAGKVPLKYCLSDILEDIKKNYMINPTKAPS